MLVGAVAGVARDELMPVRVVRAGFPGKGKWGPARLVRPAPVRGAGDMGSDQRQQAGDIRRYRARQIGCDAARLATAAFVEDRNPRLKAGAVLGEGGTGHRTRKDQMRGLGQAPEGLSPGGRIGREARTGDGDQPSAGARRASAERRCRAVASVLRASTFATAENGGFIRMALGRRSASR